MFTVIIIAITGDIATSTIGASSTITISSNMDMKTPTISYMSTMA